MPVVTTEKSLKHLAIIMDGNGRWAQARSLPRTFGHQKGTKIIKKIVKYCIGEQINNLTLYAFSIENWDRPLTEVSYLMSLLKYYLKKELINLNNMNVKLTVIGELQKLEPQVKELVEKSIYLTKNNSAINLNIALSYSSRQEIINAFKLITLQLINKTITLDQLDEQLINNNLYTANMPDPDLIIRTGGEQRLSNFLLWQAAYSELFFTNTLWPDFKITDLKKAINEFYQRERRYGIT